MNSEFHVQFDRPDLQVAFRSKSEILNFRVEKLDNDDVGSTLERQKAIESVVCSIHDELANVVSQLNKFREDVNILSSQFAETFTKLVFTSDSELVVKRLMQYLDDGLAQFDLSSEPITVWVHPDLVVEVEAHLLSETAANVKTTPDPLLQKGDCRVEGPDQGLIARIESQLDLARQRLFDKVEGEPA